MTKDEYAQLVVEGAADNGLVSKIAPTSSTSYRSKKSPFVLAHSSLPTQSQAQAQASPALAREESKIAPASPTSLRSKKSPFVVSPST